jgi:hypothetical protein
MVHVAGNTKQVGTIRGIQAAVWNGELDIMNRLMADGQTKSRFLISPGLGHRGITSLCRML